MLPEPLEVTLLVTDAFESLAIPYFVGGSLATALHGIARSTLDVDLVADLRLEQVDVLAQMLNGAFYADAAMMRDAVRQQSSFNLIHLKSMFKVDVFVRSTRPFDRSQFDRRTLHQLSDSPPRSAYVATPEDNILAKLTWYRLGDEVSDRQWQDIINVITIQGDRIDVAYLRRWATQLGVTDLLEQALRAV